MLLKPKHYYAILMMLDVAIHQRTGPVSITAIQQRQEISLSYLEQLFAKLKRRNLVRSIRGPGGGYAIKNDLSEITVLQIINAVGIETSVPKNHQNGLKQRRADQEIIKGLWKELNDATQNRLSNLTLQELAERYKTTESLSSIPIAHC